jgi:hypothetical protein
MKMTAPPTADPVGDDRLFSDGRLSASVWCSVGEYGHVGVKSCTRPHASRASQITKVIY